MVNSERGVFGIGLGLGGLTPWLIQKGGFGAAVDGVALAHNHSTNGVFASAMLRGHVRQVLGASEAGAALQEEEALTPERDTPPPEGVYTARAQLTQRPLHRHTRGG